MIEAKTMAALLDSLKDPFVFANTDHKIVYMNKAAIKHYEEGKNLHGTSLLDCHNEKSQQMIKQIWLEMQAGKEEQLITDNEKYRIYMRAVRADNGTLIGYYERYEPPKIDG